MPHCLPSLAEDASTPLGSAEEAELYPGPSGVHGHGLWGKLFFPLSQINSFRFSPLVHALAALITPGKC